MTTILKRGHQYGFTYAIASAPTAEQLQLAVASAFRSGAGVPIGGVAVTVEPGIVGSRMFHQALGSLIDLGPSGQDNEEPDPRASDFVYRNPPLQVALAIPRRARGARQAGARDGAQVTTRLARLAREWAKNPAARVSAPVDAYEEGLRDGIEMAAKKNDDWLEHGCHEGDCHEWDMARTLALLTETETEGEA